MTLLKGFTAKQVCKITGIEYSTLDYWTRSDFIEPSVAKGQGIGTKRLYSFEDIIAIKVALSLRDQGVTLQKIRKVVGYLKKHGNNLTHPLAGTVLITDGKKIFKVTDNKKMLVDILAGGQLVFALAMDKMVNKLEKRAKRITESDVA